MDSLVYPLGFKRPCPVRGRHHILMTLERQKAMR